MEGFYRVFADAQLRLEQLQASRAVGICYLDSEGRLVQVLEEDPALKEALVDYHQQRIREMRLSGQATSVAYPILEEQ